MMSNPRFRTGTKVFRLTSSSTNVDLSSSATATSTETDYVVRGLQETVRGVVFQLEKLEQLEQEEQKLEELIEQLEVFIGGKK